MGNFDDGYPNIPYTEFFFLKYQMENQVELISMENMEKGNRKRNTTPVGGDPTGLNGWLRFKIVMSNC